MFQIAIIAQLMPVHQTSKSDNIFTATFTTGITFPLWLVSIASNPVSVHLTGVHYFGYGDQVRKVVKLFVDTFNNDFKKGIPFLPTKKVIMKTIAVPLINPTSLAIIQSFIFKITSVPQPPIPLLESPIQPYISEIMEADDVEYTLAMAGPELVEFYILQAINNLNFATRIVFCI